MMTFEKWRSVVASAMKEFGDLDFQARIWTGQVKEAGTVSSHDEAITAFLHDCDIDGFLATCEKSGYFKDVLPEMRVFVAQLREHAKLHDDSEIEAILKNPRWLEISARASRLAKRLEAFP